MIIYLPGMLICLKQKQSPLKRHIKTIYKIIYEISMFKKNRKKEKRITTSSQNSQPKEMSVLKQFTRQLGSYVFK